MQAVASYVRNIAVFIIFAAILEIVLPDNKFKDYIHLVTGLILIYIMAAPLGGLLQSFQMPTALTYQFDKSILQREQAYYEEKQKEIILDEYKKNIYSQLEIIVGNYYLMTDAQVKVSEAEENFGEIESIHITATGKEVTGQRKLIRIEKVSMDKNETGETKEIKNLKKAISDFYNLSVGNIHITVQMKDR